MTQRQTHQIKYILILNIYTELKFLLLEGSVMLIRQRNLIFL